MLRGNIFPILIFFVCLFVCFVGYFIFFIFMWQKSYLCEFLASLLSLLFLLTYEFLIRWKSLEWKLLKPSPFLHFQKWTCPQRVTDSQLLLSNSQLGHEDSIFMMKVFDCWKFYQLLNFNIRKPVCLYPIIIRSDQWE